VSQRNKALEALQELNTFAAIGLHISSQAALDQRIVIEHLKTLRTAIDIAYPPEKDEDADPIGDASTPTPANSDHRALEARGSLPRSI